MIIRQAVTVEAPAKINLGLEILGKRADGFHEIRSVMVMLQLSDSLRIFTGGPVEDDGLPAIPLEDNLIAKALAVYGQAVPESPDLGWSIVKRIPVAAGLGGASSDSAAALLAANHLSGNPLSREALAELAGTLGSDVPFFLGAPVALASGRGTDLAPMAAVDRPVTLLIPDLAIVEKTRTLYSMIAPGDMSDGTRVQRVCAALAEGRLPAQADLANAFSCPLSVLAPDTVRLRQALARRGIDRFGLSGAGPAHYVIGPTADRTPTVIEQEGPSLDSVKVIRTRTRLGPLVVEAVAGDA